MSLTVTSVRLTREAGTQTPNLLDGPRRFDYLDLTNKMALLSFTSVRAGTYTGVTVEIDPATIQARDEDGVSVPVSVVSSSDTASFDGPGSSDLEVVEGEFHPISIDVDLAHSLDDDPLVPGGLVLDLRIRARQEQDDIDVDDFRGEVVSVDVNAATFVLELHEDGEDFGNLTVAVADDDDLFGVDGTAFATAAEFLAALTPGADVKGDGILQLDGTVDASTLKLEDDLLYLVEIEGSIASVDTGEGTFVLRLEEIEHGEDLAEPILAGLGDPGSITVAFDGETVFLGDDDGGALDSSVLQAGMEVEIRFTTFSDSVPFTAAIVEIDDLSIEFEGIITNISGLPDSIEVTLESESSQGLATVVTVPLSESIEIFLDAGEDPLVDAADLQTGLEVKLRGSIAGEPGSETVTASSIEIEPGTLEGVVTAVDTLAGTITVEVEEVEDPFGGDELVGSTTVTIPVGAHFQPDDDEVDSSLAELAAIFDALELGQVLVVEVSGIATPEGDVLGYDIEYEVEN